MPAVGYGYGDAAVRLRPVAVENGSAAAPVAPGYQRRAVKALLFDRVLKPAADERTPIAVRGQYDESALGRSIAEQLHWLLNTRVPIDYAVLDARTRAGRRSAVDYGLPDLTAYPVGDTHALDRLHDHLSQTIALYEPRLRDPRVTLVPIDGRRQSMEALIGGTVRIGWSEVPVTFRIALDVESAAAHGG